MHWMSGSIVKFFRFLHHYLLKIITGEMTFHQLTYISAGHYSIFALPFEDMKPVSVILPPWWHPRTDTSSHSHGWKSHFWEFLVTNDKKWSRYHLSWKVLTHPKGRKEPGGSDSRSSSVWTLAIELMLGSVEPTTQKASILRPIYPKLMLELVESNLPQARVSAFLWGAHVLVRVISLCGAWS